LCWRQKRRIQTWDLNKDIFIGEHSSEEADHPSTTTHQPIHVARVLRHLKGHLDVALCGQVVHLLRADFAVSIDRAGNKEGELRMWVKKRSRAKEKRKKTHDRSVTSPAKSSTSP
jgi:hypothetical protein